MNHSKHVPLCLQQAAQEPSGIDAAPIEGFIHNRVEQMVKHLSGVNLEIVELLHEAYIRGMQDGNLRIGELL